MAEDVRTDQPISDDAKSTQNQYWPCFTVRCDNCSGFNIELDNTMGYSPESGGWGSIDLVCNGCGTRTEIISS